METFIAKNGNTRSRRRHFRLSRDKPSGESELPQSCSQTSL